MLKDLALELQQLKGLGQHRELHSSSRSKPGVIDVKGRHLHDFANWDLFGLNFDQQLRRVAQRAIESSGVSTSSPRLLGGTREVHADGERRLSEFLGVARTLLFSSRNQAVFTLITTLVSEQDLVFVEDTSQSPVHDAAYLVNAPVFSYSGGGLGELEKELERQRPPGRTFIFVESVSGVYGSVVELLELFRIATAHGALVVVDESYALGFIGSRGAGGCELAGVVKGPLCLYGDLSFGLGGYGSFISGSEELASFLLNRSRTFAHEVALPPLLAKFTIAALERIELMPVEREALALKARGLREELDRVPGLSVCPGDTPIISLRFKRPRAAQSFAAGMFERGFLVEALNLGLPLDESSVVRLLVSSSHTEGCISELLESAQVVASRSEEVASS